MTATLLHIVLMTVISCVIRTIVSPSCLLSFFKRFKIDSVASGSSALVASSDKSTPGLLARARAMATLCFCPPDSCDGYTFSLSFKSTSSKSSCTLFRISCLLLPEYLSGYAILSNTVLLSRRLKCWNIIPIPFLARFNSLSLTFLKTSPLGVLSILVS